MKTLKQVVGWWYRGWQQFASVAGGRAEDLVGPNPWKREQLTQVGGCDD